MCVCVRIKRVKGRNGISINMYLAHLSDVFNVCQVHKKEVGKTI